MRSRTPSRRASGRPGGGSSLPRHDDRPRQERRRAAGCPRQAGDRERHDRRLQHGQWAAHEYLARRSDDAVQNEKNSNWEGAFRIPLVVRWPGKIKPGSISNEIVQHHDWFPTFLAMAGDPDVTEKLKTGYPAI